MPETRRRQRKRRMSNGRKTRFGRTAKKVEKIASDTLNILPPVGKFTRGFFSDVGVRMGGKRRRRSRRMRHKR